MQTVLVLGSSIFEQWSNAPDAVPGAQVVNRAVGGTVTAYWAEHLTAALMGLSPERVLFYCGSNDLNAEVPAAEIIANVATCFETLQRLVPSARIAYFGIIKAPQKDGKWEQIDSLNAAIAARLPTTGLYVETNAVFFSENQPLAHFFLEDGLHLTDQAYIALSDYARPLLASSD